MARSPLGRAKGSKTPRMGVVKLTQRYGSATIYAVKL
jgi:hypothetical protein